MRTLRDLGLDPNFVNTITISDMFAGLRNQTDAERAAREDTMNRGMRALTPKELAARTGDGLTNAWPWAQNGLPRDSGDR